MKIECMLSEQPKMTKVCVEVGRGCERPIWTSMKYCGGLSMLCSGLRAGGGDRSQLLLHGVRKV